MPKQTHEYKLWAPVGEQIHIPYTVAVGRSSGTGSIADDKTQMFRVCEKFDTATFIWYLNKLRHKYGKILVLVNGTVLHRSKTMMDYLARHTRRWPCVGSGGVPTHMNAVK